MKIFSFTSGKKKYGNILYIEQGLNCIFIRSKLLQFSAHTFYISPFRITRCQFIIEYFSFGWSWRSVLIYLSYESIPFFLTMCFIYVLYNMCFSYTRMNKFPAIIFDETYTTQTTSQTMKIWKGYWEVLLNPQWDGPPHTHAPRPSKQFALVLQWLCQLNRNLYCFNNVSFVNYFYQ